MAHGRSVLEPAVTGSVRHGGSFWQLFLQKPPLQLPPLPPKPCTQTQYIPIPPGLEDCFSVAIMVQTSNFAQSLQACRTGALFSCYGSELLQKRAQRRCCTPLQCSISPALHTAVSKTRQRYHSNSRVLADAASGTGNKCFVPVRDTVIQALCPLGITL